MTQLSIKRADMEKKRGETSGLSSLISTAFIYFD